MFWKITVEQAAITYMGMKSSHMTNMPKSSRKLIKNNIK